MTLPCHAEVFDRSHYASSAWQKLIRSLHLGPKYYLRDVPRYLCHRRSLGLRISDMGVWFNPFREFHARVYHCFPPPPRFQEALACCTAAGVRLTIPPYRLAGLVGAWWAARRALGDVLECGAYRGATSLLLAVLARLNGIVKTTLVLDTFAGIPHTSTFDSSRAEGEFCPPDGQADAIRRTAEKLGVSSGVEVHQGLFEETFPRLQARGSLRFAFVHIDANVYSGTWDACRFAVPATAPGGVIVFDDYNGVCDLGARLAIDRFLAGTGLRPRPLAGSSAYVRIPEKKHG